MVEATSGVVVDPFDGPEIAQLVVAIVTALGLIIVAFIANRGRKHSRVVRDQVENEHQNSENPNLREDIDAKDRAAAARAARTDRKVEAVLAKLTVVERDIGLLKSGWRTNRDDIDDLMDTAAQERQQRELWGPPPETRRERRARDAR